MAAFSEEEFLRLGFEAQGDFSWSNSKRENQIKNFRSLYGTSPKILSIIWAEIWTALQSTGNAASAIPLYMLILYRWMKSNQSENELKSCFGGISVRTIRKWRRILVVQVANLRTTKIDSNWNNTNGLWGFCRLGENKVIWNLHNATNKSALRRNRIRPLARKLRTSL